MLTERPIHPDLKAMLVANKPFSYAHLIKFERPSRPNLNGRVSTSKERYAYLTDASRNIKFDDNSTNLIGTPNGTQVYLANKVLKVGSVAEQTEAKASNYSLTLDGNGIGAYIKANISVATINSTTWDVTFTLEDGTVPELISYGFREGDKIRIWNSGTDVEVNIYKFPLANKIRVTKIDDNLPPISGLAEVALTSEEVRSILLNKNSEDYASFINREVFIYRAYFNEGLIVGSPFLLFKGIISNVQFDDTDTGIQVTWGLTSHWGDFSQVKGRITSDDFHRALDQNGIPQPQSALKIEYAYDKGFSHSETSINLLAQYTVKVEKQDVRVKNGFLGIGSKVKVKKYFVDETRNTELDFQLQAKALPVVYGVRTVPGIPIFADTLNNDSSTVYVCYAISEGEIGGLYDVYIDGNSLICSDKADFDARSKQTTDNTVQLVCRGRADRGDVLGGSTSTGGTPVDYYAGQEYLYNLGYNYTTFSNYLPYVPPVSTNTDNLGKGIVDGESISLTSPQKITIDFFSGKSGQKAASQLVEIAKANNFKIQNSYWKGTDTAEYWGPNHRLLDTAYVVVKIKIEEGETTVPSLDFVVRGKALDCYNYDYSYSHYTKAAGESADNFPLGSMVDIYTNSGTLLVSQAQIIDKWTFANPDGTPNTRFRFNVPPDLGMVDGVPSITKFYMKNSSNQTWTMVTWNYEELRCSVVGAASSPIASVSNVNGYLAFGYSNPSLGLGGDPLQNNTPLVSLVGSDITTPLELAFLDSNRVLSARTLSNSQYVSKIPYSGQAVSDATAALTSNANLVSRNTIRLNAGSSVNNYYVGYKLHLIKYDPVTDRQITQERTIVAYDVATNTATVDDVWDINYPPVTNDTVVIKPPYSDKRVSINPAIQTMDYVVSSTYGRGLDPIKDLYLPSWLESARKCDAQSNVTVKLASGGTPIAGQVYRWPATGNIIWQGTVVGTEASHVEFTDNIGKLTNNWNSWKYFSLNELVYSDDRLYIVTAAGTKTTQPTHTSGTINGLQYLSAGPVLKSTNGGADITLVTDGNPVRALKDGVRITGYSLYDCDDINYWRHLGWDEFSQRYVTRHQTNMILDTSLPLLDNVNSLLEHYGGILRYSGDKYYLDVEDAEGLIDHSDVRNITPDVIIDKIRLSDEGTRNSFNSLTASFPDPANKFESRNISFFNSEFLKADRNVPKKGNVSIPGLTNYYNTRILADKYLNKSRFGLTISFNMMPKGVLLLAGTVIQIQQPRYDWTDKKFRISSITHQSDCTVDIVAEEYDDSFYIVSNISKQAGTGAGGTGTNTSISAPSNLRASSIDTGDETYSGVEISWTNAPGSNTKNVYTELYSSTSSHMYVTVDSISGNVLHTTVPHGLKEGEIVTVQTGINGLEAGKSYFVLGVPSDSQFTLTSTKGGSILGLTNGTSLGITVMTANLIATLPTPTNYFVDVFGGINGRVVKYYWIRHKVLRS